MSEPLEEKELNASPAEADTDRGLFGAAGVPAVSQAVPLLMSVKLPIRVLMGRTQMSLREITQLGNGSVVELDCSPDDAVALVVNDRVIAQGEVVVVGGNYGVRITRIASGNEGGQPAAGNDLLRLSERLK
jgi:flagellar motor switch protein FliN/FliY